MDLTTQELATIALKGVLLLICLYFLGTRSARYLRRERGQTFFKFFLALVIWGGVLAITLTPSLARTLSTTFGLGDNLNTLIFIGFVFAFAIIFRLLRVIEHLESSISDIVSKLAVQSVMQVPTDTDNAKNSKK